MQVLWLTKSISPLSHINEPLSGPLLQEKVKDLAKTMNKPDFKPTSGWFCCWKERNAILYKRVHGEKKDADEPAAERWITDILSELIRNYKPEDIYNCDETGIYYRAMVEVVLDAFKNYLFSDPSCHQFTTTVFSLISFTRQKRGLPSRCAFVFS